MSFQEAMETTGKIVDVAGVAAIVVGILAASLIAAGAMLLPARWSGRSAVSRDAPWR